MNYHTTKQNISNLLHPDINLTLHLDENGNITSAFSRLLSFHDDLLPCFTWLPLITPLYLKKLIVKVWFLILTCLYLILCVSPSFPATSPTQPPPLKPRRKRRRNQKSPMTTWASVSIVVVISPFWSVQDLLVVFMGEWDGQE